MTSTLRLSIGRKDGKIKTVRRAKYDNFHRTTGIQRKVISNDNFTYRIILNVVKDFLSSPKKILDIGCGAGTLSLYLANEGNEVLGIDISKNAIENCVGSSKVLALDKNVSFKAMNFPIEIPAKKFNFIICSEVIEHLQNDDLALKKMFSLILPGGIVIISTPSKNAPMYRLRRAKEFDERVGHLRRYTVEELIKKCEKAGFEILDTRKTEGILRNFLFLNPIAGQFVRFIKFFLSDIITWVDNIGLRLFGESQIFVIVKKPL